MSEQNEKRRGSGIKRPVQWTHDWVVAGLTCPTVFIIFRALDFPYWEWTFIGIGVASLSVAAVVKLIDKLSLKGRYRSVTWAGEFAFTGLPPRPLFCKLLGFSNDLPVSSRLKSE